MLLDYGDVIVHVFDQENRSFYNLEHVWSDGQTSARKNLAENREQGRQITRNRMTCLPCLAPVAGIVKSGCWHATGENAILFLTKTSEAHVTSRLAEGEHI